ncbi:hypothetical protein ACP4OV_026930 [Aristida adscensionis]
MRTEVVHVAIGGMEPEDYFYSVPLLPEWEALKSLKDLFLKSENGKWTRDEREDFEDLNIDSLKVEEQPFCAINEVLKKCGGLTLAIENFAEFLASKPPHQWGKLCVDLPSFLYNDQRLGKIKKVITRSYKFLPPYLKPCFLYLNIFPEDSDIDVATVVDRWVAEGLVREKTGMRAKAIAERSWKTCWIHPMMRDIMAMISHEKFSITVGSTRSPVVPAKKFRHLALDDQSDRKLVKWMDLSGIRSLTVFNKPSESISSLICSSKMKTLRVLDFSKTTLEITQRDMRHIGELCHLSGRRRACPKNGVLSYLPQLEKDLKFPRLETIKLDGHIGKMPEWISKSSTLSVVKLYRTNLQQDDIERLDRIKSLTTLALLDSSYVGENLSFYTGSFTNYKAQAAGPCRITELASSDIYEEIIIPDSRPNHQVL